MSKKAQLILRFGLAFVFAYAAISIYLKPADWVGFVPGIVEIIMPRQTFLQLHGLLDLVLAIWLLSGVKVFYGSILAILNLASIVVFNVGALSIVFRDVGLLTAAIALAMLSKDENTRR